MEGDLLNAEVFAVVVPGEWSLERYNLLLHYLQHFVENSDMSCFCCGDKAESLTMLEGFNDPKDLRIMMLVPACPDCADAAEEGNETLLELFYLRIGRLLEAFEERGEII